ncbi:hypothetical protein NP233_g11686 [Leucocoprinus birnbaumii]|uniref:DUF6534 domain-containing protein n=1 Tax=Leucocoprinus birnbaumii TaxID=56174 RepID=A0AAD5VGN2_9AGAR|nr:hypothetical protein NP233_g11686 [Leucocoprinus birnbaumii]
MQNQVGCAVQLYYAQRIRLLTKGAFVPILLAVMAALQWIGAIMIAAGEYPSQIKGNRVEHSVQVMNRIGHVGSILWGSISSACDVFIAVYMVYYLFKYKPTSSHAHNRIFKLMRLILETGSLTVIMFAPGGFFMIPGLAIGKVYAISLLALLNNRFLIVGGREKEAPSFFLQSEVAEVDTIPWSQSVSRFTSAPTTATDLNTSKVDGEPEKLSPSPQSNTAASSRSSKASTVSGNTYEELEECALNHPSQGQTHLTPRNSSFKDGNPISHGAYIGPKYNLGEDHLQLPTTLQDVARKNEEGDVIHKRTEQKGTVTSKLLPSVTGRPVLSEATMMSLICSPMSTSNRGHEETPIYALPDSVIDEKVEAYLDFVGPRTPSRASGYLAKCTLEEKEISSTNNASNFSSPAQRTLRSPVLLGGQASSPSPREIALQLSSPILLPSSPPTSSPPPISSQPSTPEEIHDNIPKPSLTELRDMIVPSTGTPIAHHLPPNPRRPTQAAQRRQYAKLSKPFRTPCLVRPESENQRFTLSPKREWMPEKVEDDGQDIPLGTHTIGATAVTHGGVKDGGEKRRPNKKAGAQFKSPLITKSGNGPETNSQQNDPTIRLTPTIQMLERKLQIMKRAVKIKEDDQEDSLRGLIAKWTEAGQEIAWEVWATVKENNAGEEFSAINGKRSLQYFWHWEMGDDKRHKGEEDSFHLSEIAGNELEETGDIVRVGSIEESAEDEELERPHHTLGTMLRQLGIDPQTLGWDDEEETFKGIGSEI